MCLSQPKMEMPAPPAPAQESKAPDFQARRDSRRRSAMAGGSSLLTAPSGVSLAAQGSQARPTLLGQ